MENKGIDYGMGLSNCDHKTEIRYGVISQNEVLQAWADSSEPDYGQPGDYTCPECDTDFLVPDGTEWGNTVDCPNCEEDIEIVLSDYCEASSFTYDAEGYQCAAGEDGDIFIIKSPFYTICAFCSPCAPGAGYIMTTVEDGVKSYCFGHDWFDEEKAPYPVYSVETDEKIEE